MKIQPGFAFVFLGSFWFANTMVFAAGMHTFDYNGLGHNGRHLASGVYRAKLNLDGTILLKKLAVAK